ANAPVSGADLQHAISLINDAFGTTAHDCEPSSAKQPALPYGAQAPTLALLGQPCPPCRSAPYLTTHDGVEVCQPCTQRVGRAELIWDRIVQTTRAHYAATGAMPSRRALTAGVGNGGSPVDAAELGRIVDAHARDWD